MKRGGMLGALAVVIIVISALFYSSAYVVSQKDQVLVTQFGDVVRVVNALKDGKDQAGLYFKMPFTQTVHRFDRRVLEFDAKPTELTTGEKTSIYIDTFARWRIQDPKKFYEAVRSIDVALTRLSEVINSSIRIAVNSRRLIEVVRDTNRQFDQDPDSIDAQGVDAQGVDAQSTQAATEAEKPGPESEFTVKEGRREVVKAILADAAKSTVNDYGIELLDVQIKRAMYVDEVRQANETEMISERQRIAQMYRSQGKQEGDKIIGSIDFEKSKILSEAYKKAETIKGEGEAEAARVYAEAYGADPDFYGFMKSLDLYRQTLAENSTLVLGAGSDLFRYLQSGGVVPQAAQAAQEP